jgi:hypothetical protein
MHCVVKLAMCKSNRFKFTSVDRDHKVRDSLCKTSINLEFK